MFFNICLTVIFLVQIFKKPFFFVLKLLNDNKLLGTRDDKKDKHYYINFGFYLIPTKFMSPYRDTRIQGFKYFEI